MQPRISTSTKPKRPLDPMQWTDADLADYVQHHYESPQAVSLVAFLEQFRIHPLALWDLQSCHDDLSSLTNGDNALNQLVLRLAHQIRPVVSPSTPKPKPAWELSKELDIPSPPPPPPSPLPEEPELDEENNDAASTVSEWALDELPEQEEMRATGSDAGEPPVYSTTEGDYPEPMFGGLGLDTGVPSHTGYQEPQLEHAEEDLIHFDEEVQAEHGTHAAESGAEHENVEGDAQPTEPPHTDDIAEPASPLPAGATAGEDDASVHEREASQTPTGAETEGGLEEGGTREPADETTGDTPPQVDHPTAQDKPQPEDGVHDTETPEIAEEQVQTNVLGVEGVEEDVQVETAGSEGAEETSEEVHAQQETGLEALETTDSQQDPSTDATAAPVEVEEQHHTDNGQTTTPAEDDPASDTPLPDSNASSVQESHVDDDQTIPAEAEPASDTTSGDATGSGDQGGTTAPQEESAHTASSPSQETSADAAGSAAGGATPQSPPPTDTTSEGEQTTQEEALTGEEQSDTKCRAMRLPLRSSRPSRMFKGNCRRRSRHQHWILGPAAWVLQ
ncbi:hypothetical protein C8Q73DRAFT_29325 [Cubamyces lactineus]|nr:hypothetical protein C8Q73DRAFT_29325 [Cubamyces lactineus]